MGNVCLTSGPVSVLVFNTNRQDTVFKGLIGRLKGVGSDVIVTRTE